jgi:hypothetical protein
MTKRIRIDNSTFKVLKKNAPSTVNVDTATADQLAFDGFAGVPYTGIILQGTSKTSDWAAAQPSSSPYVWSGSGWYFNPFVTYRRIKTFSFPTQAVAPDVLFMVRPLSDTSWATPHYSHLNEYGSISYLSPAYDSSAQAYYYMPNSWAGTSVWASTSTDTLTLRLDYVQYSSGSLDWEFSFIVFQTFQTNVNGTWQNIPTLYT